jgi:hypothetical protein
MCFYVGQKPWRWVAAAAALVTVRAVFAQTLPEPSEPTGVTAAAPAARVQVVVLQDGGVLEGVLSQSGDRYILTRATGEVFIPASSVLLVADSREDAYEKRRARLSPPTADSHIALADWCLRQDILPQAEQELKQARALDARHHKLVLLEQRLALAISRRANPKPERPAAQQVVDVAAEVLSPQVTDSIADLPAGAVERFTRKVQPVLVNSCTTSGCHQAGSNATFQLDRAVLRGLSNRRTTMNNLAAALALVDRERPNESPLLTVPRRSHGGMKGPVFGPRHEAAFRHLYEWVAMVTEQTDPSIPEETTSPQPAANIGLMVDNEEQLRQLESPVMRLERTSAVANSTDAGMQSTSRDGSNHAGGANRDPMAHEAILPVRYGARVKRWQPRDPFDPEIFNRRYSPRRRDDQVTPVSAVEAGDTETAKKP